VAIVRSADGEREFALSEDDDPFDSFELDASSFEFDDSVFEELSMLEDEENDSIDRECVPKELSPPLELPSNSC